MTEDSSGLNTGSGIILGLCIGTAIMAGSYGIPFFTANLPLVPEGASWWSLGAGFVTLAVAAGGAILAAMSYTMNRSISRSSRFRDAVSLVGERNAITSPAGVAVLLQVSREEPAVYRSATVKALLAFAVEMEINSKYLSVDSQYRPVFKSENDKEWPRCNSAAADAFLAATREIAISLNRDHDKDGLADGRFPIQGIYLSGYIFKTEVMSRLFLHECAFAECTFVEFDFRGSILNVVIGSGVTFKGCDFRGCQINLFTYTGAMLTPDTVSQPVFSDCTFDSSSMVFSATAPEYLAQVASSLRAREESVARTWADLERAHSGDQSKVF